MRHANVAHLAHLRLDLVDALAKHFYLLEKVLKTQKGSEFSEPLQWLLVDALSDKQRGTLALSFDDHHLHY